MANTWLGWITSLLILTRKDNELALENRLGSAHYKFKLAC